MHVYLTRWRTQKSGGDSTLEEWKTLRVVPSEATALTVYNLHSGTVYQFFVMSRNILGEGKFSEIVTAKTKGKLKLIVRKDVFNNVVRKDVFNIVFKLKTDVLDKTIREFDGCQKLTLSTFM